MTLPTAAVVRAAYLPDLSGTAEDSTITLMIARADAVLASWCGFPSSSGTANATLEATAYTQYYSAPSPAEPRLLRLRVRPVTTLTSVAWDDDFDASYGTTVSSGDYTLDAVDGTVWLHPDATSITEWPEQYRGIKVVYTAGYDTGADERITAAIGSLVAHWWRGRRMAGLAGVTAGDAQIEPSAGEIPANVREIMRPIRLPEVGLGP